jgi:hypothetical protein
VSGGGRADRWARVAVRSHAVWLAVLAGVSSLLFSALWSRDPVQTHEGLETYLRTHQYLEEIGNGHWLPQLLPDAVRGAGSAFPSFYPPVAYMVAAFLSSVLNDVVLGVNVAFLLAVVLSGWSMYFMVIVVTRHRLAAATAALLYVSFPYRFTDVFVRGAFAESWSFVWFPLILAGTWRLVTLRRVPWYLPAAWAGLVLTHASIALYFAFPYGLLLLLGLWREGWRMVARMAAALVLAAGLGAWFVLPQQDMLGDVRASDAQFMFATTDAVDAERVPPDGLLGRWRNGWRGPDRDVILPDGQRCARYYCGLHAVLGTGHVMMAVLVGAATVALLRARVSGTRLSGEQRRWAWLVAALLVAYGFNLAFMITPRTFLRVLPGSFGYIQFPWRLLGIVAFVAATVVAVVVSARVLPRWVAWAVLVISATVAVTVPTLQRVPAYEPVGDNSIEKLVATNGDLGFTAIGEYLPKDSAGLGVGSYLPDAPEVSDNGRVVDWSRDGGDLRAEVVLRADTTVVFPLLYYDVYRVTAPGRGSLDTFSAEGLLAARVPRGTTEVRVTHGPTAAGRWGLAVTVLTVVVLGGMIVRRRRAEAAARAEPRPALDGGERGEHGQVEASEPTPLVREGVGGAL